MKKTTTTKSELYNILIIEDYPTWQRSFKRFLHKEPFNLLFASNYPEALSLVRKYSIDVLILDVNLSGVPENIDGLRLAEQICRHCKGVQVIIVSGCKTWQKRLRQYHFIPSYILEKQRLEHDDLIKKIYLTLNNQRCRGYPLPAGRA
jgi:CheY-like chemotaxis protein